MNHSSKNKLLTWLLVLLLVANAATITLFWLGKSKQPVAPREAPDKFLTRELKLDDKQQQSYNEFVKEHRQAVEQLRGQLRLAKDKMFDLVSKPGITDSSKTAAAQAASKITEQIDLLTVDHFIKFRTILDKEQQIKFDGVLHELTRMMAQPRPPMPPNGPRHEGPPPQ